MPPGGDGGEGQEEDAEPAGLKPPSLQQLPEGLPRAQVPEVL